MRRRLSACSGSKITSPDFLAAVPADPPRRRAPRALRFGQVEKSWLRRLMPFLGLLIVVALIYDGAIFYSRWNSNREAAQAQAEREAAQRRKAIDALGGGGLKIVAFYAAPGTIRRGAKTELCYGVIGAKTVKLEPPVDEVWPALNRCVQASPRKDTEYKLTVEDEAGHAATQSLTVKVH
jgi:hypothetical protein